MLVVAHGLSGRSDLPVPLWLALYGAAAAVVVSFVALGALWHHSRLERDTPGWLLPAAVGRVVDAAVTTVVLRVVALALLVVLLAAAAFGGGNAGVNPAPTWFYVWFWVGLVPLSLLFGPLWRRANPLRAVSWLLARASGDPAEQAVRPLPGRMASWPAVVWLILFLWVELVYDAAAQPQSVLMFVSVYALVQLVGALTYGQRWYEHGDAFEAYSTLLAHLSPWSRRPDGRIVARNPLRGLADVPVDTSLIAFICVLLGSTAFDGLTRTTFWQDVTAGQPRVSLAVIGTLGLLGAIGFVVLTYVAATRVAAVLATRAPETGAGTLPKSFAHSLLPIAAGYTVAHYFSLLVLDGQAGYILASDPFAAGMNLFGTADWRINYTAVSPQTIALVQVAAIVLGHIAGVVAAHDRAVSVFHKRDKSRSQYPLLAVMVAYTVGGIALLTGV